ncbi:DUF2459 domain-containing protein [Prosthecodimorpha staleyi]|uniref:DUF2459 domain-containing protein n=1 Tax=Prosthecodimorpha staleyi TaxID=2840188 RepID=A0A947D064_9HYPH|nr:DUF2459 domain-containing protein [Prosthecodimorpha staleyi]MBT9288121.1 DUF2459 domain-containing protein [Prosthecodimorpha staleyi]
MRRIRVVLRWCAGIVLLFGALVVLAAALTARPAVPDLFPPRGGDAAVPVLLVDHGYHVGLIVPTSRIGAHAVATGSPAMADLAARFAGYEWLEIGWGDETFYRFAPTLGDVRIGMALSALAGFDDGTVLHVVGFTGDPRRVFAAGDVIGLTLGERGFNRMARGLAATFALTPVGQPETLGPGLYGASLFYRAAGRYSLLRDCNHWVAERLAEAGVPASPVPATLSRTLMRELRWRAGAS